MLVRPPSITAFTAYKTFVCNGRSQSLQRPGRRLSQNSQLGTWGNSALIIMLSCCFPFVLPGCAASFSVNAASTAATGTIVPSPDTVDFGTVDVSQSVNIVTPPSSASAWINLYSNSGGYYGGWTAPGSRTTGFQLSSGIVVPSGTVLSVAGSTVSTEITVYGYLTPAL